MGDRGVNLSALQLQLTLAKQKKETARVALMSARLNNANATTLATANQALEVATAEVERLEQELKAAEEAR